MSVQNPAYEADVVIVGYGGSGAAAAITAHDQGASVILIEKMPVSGGNSRASGGMLPGPKRPDQATQFADYMKAVCFGTTGPEPIEAFVKGYFDLPDWIKSMGEELGYVVPHVSYSFFVPLIAHPGIPASKGLEMGTKCLMQSKGCPEATGGARMFGLLSRQVEKRGIKVLLATPAKELVKNEQGHIIGVIAEEKGQRIFIKAKKGVVLTCGGFENNPALKWDNLEPKPLGFMGSPGNTGDGIKMVQQIGAALWHMNRQVTSIGSKAPEYEAYFDMDFPAPGFIYVDKYGKRFASEPDIEKHEYWRYTLLFDNINGYEYPRVPAWVVFDEEVRRTGPINFTVAGYNLAYNVYKWSSDNSAEVAKGWILKAKSLAELAQKMKVEPKALEDTLAKYNADCDRGQDTEFNRPKESLQAIQGPPYYAIEIWPMLVNTQGGPRRDQQARVIDLEGKPIPGLFAAGEFGSIWGFLYPGGGNFAEALIYGRIAGHSAATNPETGS